MLFMAFSPPVPSLTRLERYFFTDVGNGSGVKPAENEQDPVSAVRLVLPGWLWTHHRRCSVFRMTSPRKRKAEKLGGNNFSDASLL